MAQYQAGIKKGQKHYKRTRGGSVILPNGDRITPKEIKAFRSAVSSANRKRKRLIEQLPKEARTRYSEFGVESDFVARHKSTSLARFRNKKEFNAYLRGIRRFNKVDYLDKVVNTYRTNLNRAIDNVFGSSGKDLKKFIRGLSNKELRQLTLDESFGDIGFVYYEPVAVSKKLAQLNKQVGKIRASA